MRQTVRMFRFLEPTFFAGLLDDPVLLVKVRPMGRSLLFDCGQIHHLAKRVLKRVEAAFISHAHMDHFMGIDFFLRNLLVSPRTYSLFGPPGLADKLEHKLRGYDWNLAEHFWCNLEVNEVFEDRLCTWFFQGSRRFSRGLKDEKPLLDKVIYRNQYVWVEACLADHRIPVLMFRCHEKPFFSVSEAAIDREGLVRGPWLGELKKRFHQGFTGDRPLVVLRRRNQEVAEDPLSDVSGLYHRLNEPKSTNSFGYVTDIGFTPENLDRLETLFQGVTLLVAECSFLAQEMTRARQSFHLCTQDINRIIDRLRPRFFLPMHLSKTYNDQSHRLYQELTMPPGVTLLKLPEHLLPRPLFPSDVPPPEEVTSDK